MTTTAAVSIPVACIAVMYTFNTYYSVHAVMCTNREKKTANKTRYTLNYALQVFNDRQLYAKLLERSNSVAFYYYFLPLVLTLHNTDREKSVRARYRIATLIYVCSISIRRLLFSTAIGAIEREMRKKTEIIWKWVDWCEIGMMPLLISMQWKCMRLSRAIPKHLILLCPSVLSLCTALSLLLWIS